MNEGGGFASLRAIPDPTHKNVCMSTNAPNPAPRSLIAGSGRPLSDRYCGNMWRFGHLANHPCKSRPDRAILFAAMPSVFLEPGTVVGRELRRPDMPRHHRQQRQQRHPVIARQPQRQPHRQTALAMSPAIVSKNPLPPQHPPGVARPRAAAPQLPDILPRPFAHQIIARRKTART